MHHFRSVWCEQDNRAHNKNYVLVLAQSIIKSSYEIFIFFIPEIEKNAINWCIAIAEEMQMESVLVAYTLLLANLRTSLLIFDMSPWLFVGIFHVEWSTSYCIIERRIIISVQLPLSNATWSSWHMFLNALIFLTILIIRLTATAVKLINDNSCGSSGFFSA